MSSITTGVSWATTWAQIDRSRGVSVTGKATREANTWRSASTRLTSALSAPVMVRTSSVTVSSTGSGSSGAAPAPSAASASSRAASLKGTG